MDEKANIPKLQNQIRRARTLADQAQYLGATAEDVKSALESDPNLWVKIGFTSKPQVLEPSEETQALAMGFLEDRADALTRAKATVERIKKSPQSVQVRRKTKAR